MFGSSSSRELKKIRPIQAQVLDLEEKYKGYSDSELRAMTPALKDRLAAGETLDDILPDAFAVCREAASRVLSMRHFPVQITGGIALHHGKIAEMKTGEGKTLVATLPAYLNALAGEGVHIVTVNEYLARRDSEWMGKVYQFLGLTVGLIHTGMNPAERRVAYGADITFGTNNEFGFDYLRDNMVVTKEAKSQRGHAYAIVDEVDSILIDEARTPLIISGRGDKSTDLYQKADYFARSLVYTKVAEIDEKAELEEIGGDVIVDEKAHSATLTKSGIEKAQRSFNIENITDPEHSTLYHHLNQAVKAHGIMKRDVDYVVKDGEVIIVDEFTGRLMIGRRFNEGLHQAIEAKEHVHVARESKTLATITFQNYFRMYKKLAGMTGTALTEKDEFQQIYGLDVVEIPTNKPMIREDLSDVIYKNERGKYNAVIDQVIECHEKNQPVLVGTISIEKSEILSKLLTRRGIKHQVLNAKYHDKEAMIVAQAGTPGAVTIATNMAGRGTDIMLGGNAEFLAKERMAKEGATDEDILAATSYYETEDENVLELRNTYKNYYNEYREQIAPEAEKAKAAGGLFIIGTERHESRRIDNQLRGRSGRQGDPGASRFFLSLDDDLMRLFGGERLNVLMETLKIEEDTPIESKMLTKIIEDAQRKVEGRNFSIRKSVLDYDDVMNHQRETIYSERDMVLDGVDIKDKIIDMIHENIQNNVDLYAFEGENGIEWNLTGLRSHYPGWLTTDRDLRYKADELDSLTKERVTEDLTRLADELYEAKEARLTPEVMRVLERLVLLRCVDSNWMDHIDNMDELRKGISLRSYGQKNPVVEYRIEGYAMFDDMVAAIREDTCKMIMTAEIVSQVRKDVEANAKEAENSHNASSESGRAPAKKIAKPGRNDPCPCGSGKKYKNCHGRTPQKI